MTVPTFTVDFNARGRSGWIKASRRRANGPFVVGQAVRAVDPDEGMEFDARVAEIEQDGRRVWLEIDWEDAAARSDQAGVGQAHAGNAATFEVYTDSHGQYRWRLRSARGRIIASSDRSYAARSDVLDSIETMRRDAASAQIDIPA
jgi:uncharacterized protein YegP (UPF0339 family)